MFFISSKVFLFLIKPIVWIAFLLICAIFSKNKYKRKKLLIYSTLLLFFFSNSFLVGKAFNFYEASYPPKQKYTVGILLGGFANLNKRNQETEFSWTGDRLFQTIALYKQGIIQKILISGGSANLINHEMIEGNAVVAYLKKIGIPDSAILLENQSRNTLENAKYSLDIIKKADAQAKILVITSAWHIPRAKLIFEKLSNLPIAYYPTNYIGQTEYDFGDCVVPSASALGNWELLFKEWIGLIVDRVRD